MKKDASYGKRDHSLKQRMESIPLTPMIDVVFQLLIFFVLTFEIPDRLTEMPIFRPGPDDSEDQEATLLQNTITIYADPDGNAPYTLNDRGSISLSSLENYVFSVADNDPTQTVVIKATVDSRHKHLVALLNLMMDAGLENISLFSVK